MKLSHTLTYLAVAFALTSCAGKAFDSSEAERVLSMSPIFADSTCVATMTTGCYTADSAALSTLQRLAADGMVTYDTVAGAAPYTVNVALTDAAKAYVLTGAAGGDMELSDNDLRTEAAIETMVQENAAEAEASRKGGPEAVGNRVLLGRYTLKSVDSINTDSVADGVASCRFSYTFTPTPFGKAIMNAPADSVLTATATFRRSGEGWALSDNPVK